ncbi:metallophosphoesterase MPPED2-like isoform X1 [Asterias rubens]|uniref:metallophosphoesterase MPPED2-like isoform X1 n=1 Tax=Asterias rubens TaxID=7604 RepID=UPI001454F37D|nr:metallophosphoesterase MPPED2-like isoform X1 [Asterias rubens]XP_033629824.1 metallophosphoesterase MPPED2-like isoform X1 [Asterias rubens]
MSFRRFLRATGGRSLSSKPRDEDIKDEYPGEVTVHPETNKPTYVWDCIKNKSSTVCRVVQPLDPSTPKPEDAVRFVCISDTHNQAARLLPTIPDGDVLIHGGDFTNVGSLKEIKQFNDFMGKLPHRHKIVIAGNHEVTFDRQLMTEQNSHVFMSFATALQEVKQEDWKHIPSHLTNCTYLEDAEVNIMGFRIYGSPWQPEFCDWAFNLPRGKPLLDKWNLIPTGIDILVTHGPPLGHGDLTTSKERAGCVELLTSIQRRLKPKYHIFGHIHEGYGVTTDNTTTFINASICTVNYSPSNHPIVFDLPTPKIPTMEAETSL